MPITLPRSGGNPACPVLLVRPGLPRRRESRPTSSQPTRHRPKLRRPFPAKPCILAKPPLRPNSWLAVLAGTTCAPADLAWYSVPQPRGFLTGQPLLQLSVIRPGLRERPALRLRRVLLHRAPSFPFRSSSNQERNGKDPQHTPTRQTGRACPRSAIHPHASSLQRLHHSDRTSESGWLPMVASERQRCLTRAARRIPTRCCPDHGRTVQNRRQHRRHRH